MKQFFILDIHLVMVHYTCMAPYVPWTIEMYASVAIAADVADDVLSQQ